MSAASGRIGVVLLNMGGPDSLGAVRPFLANLFMDREMFRLPLWPLTQPLFAWIVSGLRARKVRDYYAEIGGGSPLNAQTEAQRKALEEALRTDGIDAVVTVAMRYWHPRARQAALALKEAGVSRVVLLPLYPQYFSATTGSSLKDFRKAMAWAGLSVPVAEIRSYPDDPAYIAALSAKVRASLDKAKAAGAPDPLHILFSAHGVPVSFIKRGDPYLDEVMCTVAAVMASFPDVDHSLSFQSRTGPIEWLSPDTEEQTRVLGGQGVKTLVVVPVAFVSEHIETLHELDLRLSVVAKEAGVTRFVRVPTLSDDPAFIGSLAALVRTTL